MYQRPLTIILAVIELFVIVFALDHVSGLRVLDTFIWSINMETIWPTLIRVVLTVIVSIFAICEILFAIAFLSKS